MRKSLLIIALTLLANAAWAGQITTEQAKTIASKFFNSNTGMAKAPAQGASATIRLAHTSKAYYAFNRGQKDGFVIVAADDRAAAEVLGYSDEGTFSADNMPEAMRWWLGEYERELEHAAGSDATNSRDKLRRALPVYDAIAPLTKSKWDQNSPYNSLCPTYYGVKCPTGCAATALAQIMYYHKWPQTGKGYHAYAWYVNGQKAGSLSADFSQSTYDWESMTDTYNSTSTQASKNAVARLMYDVGVASDMQYGPSSSGASSIISLVALEKYFSYDPSVNMLSRDYYGIEEWNEMLYNSLASGYPIFYTGLTTKNEGHAFVIDGYKNGYFHLNWGWGGVSNGYFLTTALDPYEQGTGGAASGFNYGQEAALNIRPAETGSTYEPLMYCTGRFAVSPANTASWATVTFSGGFYNYTSTTCNMTLGIMVEDANGNSTFLEAYNTTVNYSPATGYNAMNVPMSNFPQAEGTYKVYPAYRDNATGTWYKMLTKITQRQYIVAKTEQDGSIKFSYPTESEPEITTTAINATSTPYAGQQFTVEATLSNSGKEYVGNIQLAIAPQGSLQITDKSEITLIDVPQGESVNLEFTMTAPNATGNYDLLVITEYGTPLGDSQTISVTETPSGQPKLTMAAPIAMADADNASADDITFTASIGCTNGFYGGKLYAYLFPQNNSHGTTYFISNIYIGKDEKKTVTFNGSLPNAKAGDKFKVQVFSLNGLTPLTIGPDSNNSLTITIGSTSGVETAHTDVDTMHDIAIFNLAGTCLRRQRGTEADLSGLAPGVYIVKTDGEAKRIVKK